MSIAFVWDKPPEGSVDRVFGSLLRTANIDRACATIAHVFSGKEDEPEFLMKDKAAAKAAMERLNVELPKANVIVPLGGVALWALAEDTRIDLFRGTVIKATRVARGTKLVPTLHPERVMRQWKFYTMVAGDLIRADGEADSPTVEYPKVRLILEPQLADVEKFCNDCLTSEMVSVDIETGFGGITCIGLAPTADTAICIPFMDIRKASKSYWGTAELEHRAWIAVKQVLEAPVPKLFQNGPYDVYWLLDKMGIGVRNYCEDTRLLHKAMFPELPADLGSMGATYTRLGAWKAWSARNQTVEKRDA